ncbi:unnamed protein product [Moneuplotes crassus]|uniref:Uncharacterized protein n=1 Tax=Euplotes crassus TaxID=5936 RepID=A0AAD1U323_EUPCR|nr:unnamed protein product [Moneuplotes crassus]
MQPPHSSNTQKFHKTIIHTLKNHPNASLSGTTFDATHLQHLLSRPHSATSNPPSLNLPPSFPSHFPTGDNSKRDSSNPSLKRNPIDYYYTKYNRFLKDGSGDKGTEVMRLDYSNGQIPRATFQTRSVPDLEKHGANNFGSISNTNSRISPFKIPKTETKFKSSKFNAQTQIAKINQKAMCPKRTTKQSSFFTENSSNFFTKNSALNPRITVIKDIKDNKSLTKCISQIPKKSNMILRGIERQLISLEYSNKAIHEIKKISLTGNGNERTSKQKVAMGDLKKVYRNCDKKLHSKKKQIKPKKRIYRMKPKNSYLQRNPILGQGVDIQGRSRSVQKAQSQNLERCSVKSMEEDHRGREVDRKYQVKSSQQQRRDMLEEKQKMKSLKDQKTILAQNNRILRNLFHHSEHYSRMMDSP